MTKLYAFDFDGTLTTRDTLLEFIRYACGTPRFMLGFLIHSPLLVLMKLRLYPNGRTKERIFSWFFKGMKQDTFDGLCRRFAADSRHLLRPDTTAALEQAKASGAEILIVSASIDNWVADSSPPTAMVRRRCVVSLPSIQTVPPTTLLPMATAVATVNSWPLQTKRTKYEGLSRQNDASTGPYVPR